VRAVKLMRHELIPGCIPAALKGPITCRGWPPPITPPPIFESQHKSCKAQQSVLGQGGNVLAPSYTSLRTKIFPIFAELSPPAYLLMLMLYADAGRRGCPMTSRSLYTSCHLKVPLSQSARKSSRLIHILVSW
jgi:hypothetical protein